MKKKIGSHTSGSILANKKKYVQSNFSFLETFRNLILITNAMCDFSIGPTKNNQSSFIMIAFVCKEQIAVK